MPSSVASSARSRWRALALDPLHHDVEPPSARPRGRGSAPRWVADARREARLVEEHLHEVRFVGEVRLHRLDRDEALEAAGSSTRPRNTVPMPPDAIVRSRLYRPAGDAIAGEITWTRASAHLALRPVGRWRRANPGSPERDLRAAGGARARAGLITSAPGSDPPEIGGLVEEPIEPRVRELLLHRCWRGAARSGS